MSIDELPKAKGASEQEFSFKNVKLFKNETLGTGSYGAVCKAKCDQLICAAKLLYPVLFQMQAPDQGREHREPLNRFEQECRFLSHINHPNIVQYLGTYRDPETNAPVLLMELMDESLTHFLESSPGDISYHIQVNLSQDIAQALAFLHANGIIHRDLSSNNVLLIAGSRAKVSDFGMLGFTNATRLATMTTCPGTPAFMSPEALNEPPVYTEKLDTFSLGVLLVQMMTRQYPKPDDRFRTIQIPDPQNTDRILQVLAAIPEIDRRRDHISLIEPTQPLLPIALECLKDRDEERPSSQQLCQMIEETRRTDRYDHSLFHNRGEPSQMYDRPFQEQMRAKDEQLQSYRSDLDSKEKEIKQLKAKVNHDGGENDEIQQLKERLEQAHKEIQKANVKDSEMKAQLDEAQRENQKQLQAKDKEIQNLRARLDQVHRENHQELQAKDIEIRHLGVILEQEVQERDIELRRLSDHLESNQEIISAHEKTITQLETSTRELRVNSRRASESEVAPQPIKQTNNGLMWTTQPNSPKGIFAGSCTEIGNTVYFKTRNQSTVYEHNSTSTTSVWCELPPHPLTNYTIVTVSNMLVTVGGAFENWLGNDKCSNQLYIYKKRKWDKYYPAMPTKREAPGVINTGSELIVAGGSNDGKHVSTVEIMNIRSKTWSAVSSLPFSTFQPSMTIYGEQIYLHPRYAPYGQDRYQHTVLQCSLGELVGSKPKAIKWNSICPLPVSCSTLVTLSGHLLAVGGKKITCKSKEDETKEVYEYNQMTDSWEVVSKMIEARHYCLLTQLPDNKLLVAGGATSDRTMEIAYFF